MLCPLEALSSSNLWNVISWPQHSGTSKSAALWAVLERPQRIFICFYHRHMKTLWPSCGILCYKALVQSVLWERGMLWLSHVYGTIRRRVSPGTGRMMNHAISTFKPASTIYIKCHGKFQPHVPSHGPFCPLHTAQFPSACSPLPRAVSTACKSKSKMQRACEMNRHSIPSIWKSHPFLKKNKSFYVIFMVPRNLWRMGLCYKKVSWK